MNSTTLTLNTVKSTYHVPNNLDSVDLIKEENIISGSDNDSISFKAHFSINRPSDFKHYYQYLPRLWNNLPWYVLVRLQDNFHTPEIYVGIGNVPEEEASELNFLCSVKLHLLKDEIMTSDIEMTESIDSISSDSGGSGDVRGGGSMSLSFDVHETVGFVANGGMGLKLECNLRGNDGGTLFANSEELFRDKTRRIQGGQQVRFSLKIDVVKDRTKTKIAKLKSGVCKYPGLAGLQNLGATCYLNSLLQMLFHINEFRRIIFQAPFENQEFHTSKTLCLQNIFRNMQTSKFIVNTTPLLTAFGWTGADAFEQQDVQEMMRILLDKLEEQLKGTAVDGSIKKLFAGSIRSYIKCLNVNYESKREEDFYDIQLNVKDCKCIADSFKKYVEIELLNGENQYHADNLGKQDAEKGVIFTKFPPVLTILLKRFDFDMTTFRHMKLHDRFEFSLKMNLSDYLAKDCPEDDCNYVLHSVLVHIGDVGGGHYICFIRPSYGYDYAATSVTMMDVQNWERRNLDSKFLSVRESEMYRGKWFKFNDEQVNQVHEHEAIELQYGRNTKDFKGSLESAYMVVYVKEQLAGNIMKHINDEEIPQGLLSRLEKEEEILSIQKRNTLFMSYCGSVKFWNDLEINDREAFLHNRFQDIFLKGDVSNNNISLLYNSTRLYALCEYAFRQSKSPFRFRMFLVELAKGRKNLRVSKRITFNDLNELAAAPLQDGETYFIREICDSEFNEAFYQQYETQYYKLVEEQNIILGNLRNELTKLPEFSTTDTQTAGSISMNIDGSNLRISNTLTFVIALCRCGSSYNSILDLYISGKQKIMIQQEFDHINKEFLKLFEDFGKRIVYQNSTLVFFKLFDPYNIFGGCLQRYNEEITDNKMVDELCSREANLGNEERDCNIGTLCQRFHLYREYFPMKFLGYEEILECNASSFRDICIDLIKKKFSIQYPNESSEGYRARLESLNLIIDSLSSHLRMFSFQDPVTFSPLEFPVSIDIDNEENNSARALPNYFLKLPPNGVSGLVILDFFDIGNNTKKISDIVNNECSWLVTPKLNIDEIGEWCDKMVFNRRKVIFQPASDIDEFVVIRTNLHANLKNHEESKIQTKLYYSDDDDDDDDDDVLMSAETDKTNNSKQPGFGATLETCGTFQITQEIRKHYFNACHFMEFLNNNYTMQHLIEILSDRLRVDHRRLVLYLCTEHDPFAFAKDFPPLYFGMPNAATERLTDVYSRAERNLKISSSTVLKIYYRIAPFMIEDKLNFEVILAGRSLRYLRRSFLHSEFSQSETSNSKSSLVDIGVGSKRSSDDADCSDESSKKSKSSMECIDVFEWAKSSSNTDLSSQPIQVYSKDNYDPNNDNNKYNIFCSDYCIGDKIYAKVSKGRTADELIETIHNSIVIPSNLSLLEKWSSKCSRILSNSSENSNLDPISIARSKINADSSAYVMFLIKTHNNLNQISDLVFGSRLVDDLPALWTHTQQSMHYKIGLQLVDSNECANIKGENPDKRSMLVLVHNFILLGQGCKLCPIEDFGCPFVSYIMEGDDYSSICKRFSECTGDSYEDLMEHKISLVLNKLPVQLPGYKESSSLGSHNMNVNEHDCGKIWELMKEKYPNFAENSYTEFYESAAKFKRQNQTKVSESGVLSIKSSSGLTGIDGSLTLTGGENSFSTSKILTLSSKSRVTLAPSNPNPNPNPVKIDLPIIGIQRSASQRSQGSHQRSMKIL